MREFTVPPLDAPPLVGGLADAVFHRAGRFPERVALSRRGASGDWEEVTSARFRDEVLALAKGLIADGVRFGDRVALMCRTRYEWTLFDFALWTVGAHSVPVYPTSSREQVFWMLQDAEVSAALVEHEDHAMTVGSLIGGLPLLKRLWQLDAGAVDGLMAAGERIDDEVVHRHRRAVTPDSTATVVYTSGTSGRPRGCVLTHAHLMFECDTLNEHWEAALRGRPGEDASTLLFLPLAHVYGRMVQIAAVRSGVRLAHQPAVAGDELLADLASFRPTFVLAVPYVFEKIYAEVRRTAERDGKAGSFEKAAEAAVRYAEAVEQRAFGRGPGPSAAMRVQHQLFDRTVYSRVRELFGGRMRHAMSGGSAMDRRLGLFFEGAGITVMEGYGLTETAGAATGNPPGRTKFGTVGPPVPGTTVHIAEDGEVWLHGPQVFAGYHSDPAATADVLHDGWLATGDLGALDEDGYLTIVGRKKEVLVTSGGKSVSPVPLEQRVCSHPLVAQCLVVGDDRPFVAALVTVDQEAVDHWLAMLRRPALAPGELVRDPELETEIRRAVVQANAQVSQAESIRTFRILAHPFTEEHGLLTPSLKLKRRAIEEAYAAEVEALYR
ncbi:MULTISPECIES: AMP-dependent synthetase/ligase [Streptomyces]|uniref:Long-chain fatty acid--CoA ligase n=1 Tax=Streptomyces tsukubensis (strain DSM 42081 / NBRC 108919 / NRRL 18488 / 9993) TaxID=1114943 RepID=I2N9A4_STRT9|nr:MULTISPECIES: AMP-dependent synthetase/ligase [Streptomyces]EIF93601.1 long chain fatty acid:CoA ligase [Streptomyces tsukubensis NRRL18488]MYS63536.1 AMP-binding protein [Streptomyces sp. SID5473]QKM66600.1 long-chain fatty acid--CoA ligase [Streptomyces tsukubensis NRRL18488]TAI45057.1 long-chain fatty acid--CoA ligase [Streptomyces tsukubensis]